ncbi:MAG TPA: type II secretion system minor pseudopilin GspI [Candidatus Competibacteraceae bacterium]|nr:type II secretion system minor pseudopilin GspI [Candidatus Competibacteraceae bacterium]
MRRRAQAGFTLLEVLVALAVLAISLGALIRVAGSALDSVGYLKRQTLAGWVAQNKLNELLLAAAGNSAESASGTSAMAGRDWHWQVRLLNTADPDLQRIEVSVALDEGAPPLAHLVGFRPRPAGP